MGINPEPAVKKPEATAGLTHFRRAFSHVLRYKARLSWLVFCVIVIGVLYSAGIAAMLPVLKIMISEEGLHGWVRQSRADARLGVSLQYRVAKNAPGFRVLKVHSGKPAAGVLEADDEILRVNGRAVSIDTADSVAADIVALPAGEPAVLRIRRDGAESDVTVRPGEESWLLERAGWAVSLLPDGGHDEKLKALCLVLWVILSMTFWSAVARFFQEYLTELISGRALLDIRCRAFAAVVHGRLADVSDKGVNDVLGRFGKEYEDLRDGFVQVMGRLFREPVKALAVIVVAFYLDWTLTVACIIAVPVVAVFIKRLGKRMHRAARKSLEATGTMTSLLQQVLLGLRVVKGYTAEGYERRRYLRENRNYYKYTMKFAKLEAFAEPTMEFLAGCGAALMAVWAAHLTFSGQMRPEDFFAFIVCMVALADPARKLSSVVSKVKKADAAAKRIFELIDKPTEESVSLAGDAPGAGRHIGGTVGKLREALEFRSVGFAYGDGAEVLRDIDLTVRAGETVALVGPNGSGKTTLVSLVPRFFPPTRGQVLWDGQDIRACSPGSLRRQIGLVTQDAVIFKDTVHNNIAYGDPGRPREDVIAAARKARADEFIAGIRDPEGNTGYDAVLSEHGQSLSGGQRQRIALARAILRDPSLLILDEATSQIDSESEGHIKAALDEFAKGRTTLVIAHRLSTVQSADRIVVMEAGRILAVGRHTDLLRTDPLYRRLCERQFFTDPDAGQANNSKEVADGRPRLTETVS